MKRIFAVTGAAGHLGRYVVSQLLEKGEQVRGLFLPSETFTNPDGSKRAPDAFIGDIRDRSSVDAFLAHDPDADLNVVHCAGMISIDDQPNPLIADVNVNGTKVMLSAAKAASVRRFVYVSSIHAVPELPQGTVQSEISHFDPALVVGEYAKTKATATQLVLDAAAEGMDALTVHPSGIVGPNSPMSAMMTKLAMDFLRGRLPIAVKGGFDFVDVRDVAAGILRALEVGRKGESYFLTNQFYRIRDILDAIAESSGKPKTRIYLSTGFVRIFTPFVGWLSQLRGTKPLFTAYSMYTLAQNALYTNRKAVNELRFRTRPIEETVRDLVGWLTPLLATAK